MKDQSNVFRHILPLFLLFISFFAHSQQNIDWEKEKEKDISKYASPDNGVITSISPESVIYTTRNGVLTTEDSTGFRHLLKDESNPFNLADFGRLADVNIDEARAIAEEYLEASRDYNNWESARITKVTPLWSEKGILTTYEFKLVLKNGKDAGAVYVEAWNIYGGVSKAKLQGKTMTENLQQQYEEKSGQRLASKTYRFLHNGITPTALQVYEPDGSYNIISIDPSTTIKDFSAIERRKKMFGHYRSSFKKKRIKE